MSLLGYNIVRNGPTRRARSRSQLKVPSARLGVSKFSDIFMPSMCFHFQAKRSI